MDFGRYDTYDALSAAEQDGIAAVGGQPGGEGEVSLDPAPYLGFDSSGSYNGGEYYWGWMTSPVYEAATPFDTLVPS